MIENYFVSNCYEVEKLKFANGSTISTKSFSFDTQAGLPTRCLNRGLVYNSDFNYVCGTDERDFGYQIGTDGLFGAMNKKNRIYGGSGNDYIESGLGDDLLVGGSGEDMLMDSSTSLESNQAQTYNPGSGRDLMYGTEYKDTIEFERGSGENIWIDWFCSTVDLVKINENISESEVYFTTDPNKSDHPIYIKIANTSDSITIGNLHSVDIANGRCSGFVDVHFESSGNTIPWNTIIDRAGLTGVVPYFNK